MNGDRAHGLTSDELCAVAGCTYRQLHYWATRGFITGESLKLGSGYQHAWGRREARVVRVMTRLVKAGVRPDVAGAAAREAKNLGDGLWHVTLPGDLYLDVRIRGAVSQAIDYTPTPATAAAANA